MTCRTLRKCRWPSRAASARQTAADRPSTSSRRPAATRSAEPGSPVMPASGDSRATSLTAVRLTWQATQKNKFGFYIDYTKNCSGGAYKEGGSQCRAPGDGWVASGPGVTPGTATVSPESGTIWDAPAKIMQASWTSPLSNRMFFESGYSAFYTDNGDPRPYGVLTDFIPVTEQSTGAGVPFANFIYRGFNPAPSSFQKHATWKPAMSYITGSHNMKWGYQAGYMSY